MSAIDVKNITTPNNFDLTINTVGSGTDIIFKSNGTQTAKIDQAGNLTLTGTVDGVDIQTLNTAVTANTAKTGITSSQATAITAALPKAGGTVTGNILHNDNVVSSWGTGGDLSIYHDGSNSYIRDSGDGDIHIRSDAGFRVQNAGGTENYIYAAADGLVRLYHNNTGKLDTTATGVTVTGKVTASGVYNSSDLVLESNSNIYLNRQEGGGATMIRAIVDGAVELMHDNTKKFETNTTGIGVTGTVTSTSMSVEKVGIRSSLVKSIEEVYGISGTISSSGNIIIDIDFNSSSATSTFVEISLFAYDGRYISYKHGAYWGTSWSGPHGSSVIENNLSSGMAVSFNNSPTAAHEVYTITSTGLTYPVVRVKVMGGATTASTNPSITFSHNN